MAGPRAFSSNGPAWRGEAGKRGAALRFGEQSSPSLSPRPPPAPWPRCELSPARPLLHQGTVLGWGGRCQRELPASVAVGALRTVGGGVPRQRQQSSRDPGLLPSSRGLSGTGEPPRRPLQGVSVLVWACPQTPGPHTCPRLQQGDSSVGGDRLEMDPVLWGCFCKDFAGTKATPFRVI